MLKPSEDKIFTFDHLKTFFKHTDYHGYLHPYNYFEWTSYVREAFFSEMCTDFKQILESPIKMMTAKIDSFILGESSFGDEFYARFSVGKIKRVSCDIIVRFFNKRLKKIVCETQHTLVFMDSTTQKFAPIPESIREAISRFGEPETPEKNLTSYQTDEL